MTREGQTAVTRRENYTAPAFHITTVHLSFDLDPLKTRVLNRMHIKRAQPGGNEALRLDGQELTLTRVLINGQGVSFRTEGDQLVLDQVPDEFDLELLTLCAPEKNTQLMGLYVSNGGFFTQCESEGFRRITYFLDRPDVMSVFTVTLRADAQKFPVLLSNGNLIEEGALDEGRHFATWHDPHPKPSYLFALVAGQLVCREQRITTRSGHSHLLQVYVRPGDLDKTGHAMDSLMASVLWDEARFHLPLDLERFMVVAVGDFNMGAMENKGLNIFNTKFVLANPATATDADYANIESVVAHEYFHNWTGNRITCRDWFQLSLKEGLTVFRDQEFSQDMAGAFGGDPFSPAMSARAVKRIEDVRNLRMVQFSEDAGPMAHPVRPEQYLEISNFYTATVYEKGAEVVRMMQTLVGREGFVKGMSLYFERHDGQAVTCDDFAQAIADANPHSALAQHLDQFKHWYAQAGTPRLHAHGEFDATAHTYTLTLRQQAPALLSFEGQAHPAPQPFVIPVALGLIGPEGQALPLKLQGAAPQADRFEHLTVLTTQTTTLVFEDLSGLTAAPVPSLLRGFSAPVVLSDDLSDDQRLILLAHDTDPFNRWEAAQQLALSRALTLIKAPTLPAHIELDAPFVEAMRQVLRHPDLDSAFKELVLTLPGQAMIAEQLTQWDPQRIHAVREGMRLSLAEALFDDWVNAFAANQVHGGYSPDSVSCGKRALANLALHHIVLAAVQRGDSVWPGRAYQRFKDASDMSTRLGALSALVNAHSTLAEPALAQFHALFSEEALVIDKWFALQAATPERDNKVWTQVRKLMQHPDFSLRNPNRARSLITTFCHGNPAAFHRTDAAGYVFWSERVMELDGLNPQVASRLARALDHWKKLVEPYRSAAGEALKRVSSKPDLSKDVREVVLRALG